uniref:ADP-ribosylation factor-like protein 6 n=1 Tax=Tetraselmis chuii TaxID=63592 RepID=A0A7S1X0C1_9CHLO|mmetsp:Transcript_17684/g.31529  ORF Transcript_17684/g.31529 Transcript_17684/m.31529 type:complete len:185 (+) Transcript_17684:279-833(+)
MGVLGKFMQAVGLSKVKASIIVVGLQNSGKTSIITTLHPEKGEAVPTVGFSVDKFSFSSTKLTVMDMSGQSKYHALWECYFKDVQGVVFVVDSADPSQLKEAQRVLLATLEHSDLKGIPLLVFANKMDLAHALTKVEVAEKLQLASDAAITGRAWQMAACSAKTGEGIQDGMKWILQQAKKRKH